MASIKLGLGDAVLPGQVQVESELLVFPAVARAVTVTRLRSRGDSSRRVHTWPNSVSSVTLTRAGAKSPNIFAAPDGSLSAAGLTCFVILASFC